MSVTLETDDDGAARWAIRIDSGALSAAESEELEAWLTGAERRAGALLRAQAALSYLDRGRALGTVNAEPEDVPQHRSWRGRRGFLATMMAAGAAAAFGGFWLLEPGPEAIGTGVGEIRQVPLADGSSVTINTDSRLAVAMKEKHRLVRLDSGEAWFRVAPDQARPFTVEAGSVRVRAVGTAFSVRRRDDGADVLVTEGTVDTWVVGNEAERRRIAAGSRGFVADAVPRIEIAAAPQEIDRALAWRSGELALDGETLGYAVAEINRYNRRKLLIDDPSLAQEQLVGYFRTNEPENFGRAVAGMTGAHVVTDGDTIRLVRAPR